LELKGLVVVVVAYVVAMNFTQVLMPAFFKHFEIPMVV
jgi:hypothetical protein